MDALLWHNSDEITINSMSLDNPTFTISNLDSSACPCQPKDNKLGNIDSINTFYLNQLSEYGDIMNFSDCVDNLKCTGININGCVYIADNDQGIDGGIIIVIGILFGNCFSLWNVTRFQIVFILVRLSFCHGIDVL